MKVPATHKWTFSARFRKNTFGWRSSRLAVQRVKEAVSEIKKATRKQPGSGGEGAVLFLEKVSPALSCVDSSSGAIGTAVNNAIAALVQIIANAPVADALCDEWLERLWEAVEQDDMPYIELLSDYWGKLCVTPDRSSCWAEKFIGTVRLIWDPDRTQGDYFKGTTACLSALFESGRYAEILELLEMAPYRMWHYRQWGVQALLAQGKKDKALRYAEDSRGLNEPDSLITEACEAILLSSGMAGEAYRLYALEANRKTTYLATFRSIVRKYPHKKLAEILQDLVGSTPGDEGKWFAAAKSVGLYEQAVELANRTPCDPKTLERIRKLVAGERFGERFVTKILGRELELNQLESDSC